VNVGLELPFSCGNFVIRINYYSITSFISLLSENYFQQNLVLCIDVGSFGTANFFSRKVNID